MKPRVVFDCMIYLQAAANEFGPSGRCISEVEEGNLELCISPEIENEVRRTLTRPNVLRKFRALTPSHVERFFKRLEQFALKQMDVPVVFDLKRDPKDSKYINLAIAAQAKWIVSRDNDLLELMTGTDADSAAFRSACPDIAILDPIAFLNAISPKAP